MGSSQSSLAESEMFISGEKILNRKGRDRAGSPSHDLAPSATMSTCMEGQLASPAFVGHMAPPCVDANCSTKVSSADFYDSNRATPVMFTRPEVHEAAAPDYYTFVPAPCPVASRSTSLDSDEAFEQALANDIVTSVDEEHSAADSHTEKAEQGKAGTDDKPTTSQAELLLALSGSPPPAKPKPMSLDHVQLINRTLKSYGPVHVTMSSDPPYNILCVSPGWEKLCGVSSHAASGKTLSVLQGPMTNPDAIDKLVQAAYQKKQTSVRPPSSCEPTT